VNDRLLPPTPRPVEGIDLRRLPIGPEEAFVLSRVDGQASEADIALATGLDPARVRAHLERLTELGAVRFEAPEPRREWPEPERHAAVASARLSHPAVEAPPASSSSHPPIRGLYDPTELDEPVDLDLARKRRILDLFYRLDIVTHYELLGVEPAADKKTIKAAYYEAVALFHPDKYFGKNLGSFKSKLEKVFARLTEAHDLLTRSVLREEYDRYLRTQQKNRSLERLADERRRASEIAKVEQAIEEQARVAERAKHSRPPPPSAHAPPPVSRPPDPESRRRALARRLGVTTPPPRSQDPASVGRAREEVGDELRRRYEDRLTRARQQQMAGYLRAVEEALAENKPASAANALRIALALAPDDAALAARLVAVQAQADAELASSYLEQARYEERAGRLLEAARSYERSARGKPSAQILERAAHCLIQGQGDIRHAVELAKQAVALAPSLIQARLTLVRGFQAATMHASAEKELERASELAPNDDNIKDWLKRIRRERA
jgi:curved DNA-binding protein CbpA